MSEDKNAVFTFAQPPPSWEFILVDGQFKTSIQVPEGGEPNLFHRWMQRLCFGFKWVKL